MKNSILILAFCCMSSLLCNAQTDSTATVPAKHPTDFERFTLVRFSPFHTFDDAFQLSIEAFIDKSYRRSFVLIPLLYLENTRFKKESGFSMEVQYRVYPLGFMKMKPDGKTTIRGFYVAPSIAFGNTLFKRYSYRSYVVTPEIQYNGSTECTWFTPALVFGYQFSILKAGFIDINIGGGLKLNTIKSEDGDFSSEANDQYGDPNIFTRNYQGFLPKMSFTVGVRF